METRKNLPVLPSNAPALSPRTSILISQSEDLISPLSPEGCRNCNLGLDCRACRLSHVCSKCQQRGHGAHSCQSDVLGTTSGNPNLTPLEPLSLFDNNFRSDRHYESKPGTAFVSPPYHTAQAAIRLTQKKERRDIWQRWEIQSQRYLAYRRKARSKKAGSKEDVWPDDVEEAFQIAIRLYAKRGRTKDELNGRQAGGNEFISDWILKQTGQKRCRKQISSHIQTLKGFLGDVPSWMDLVTAWPVGKQEKSKALKHTGIGYDDPSLVSPSSNKHLGNSSARPLPTAILGSNTPQDPTIRSVQFNMHLSNEVISTKTHIYTSIQSEIGSAPRTLEQVPQWQVLFPKLATRYSESRVDCPLFLFESRLRLIDDILLGLSLGIEFAIDFAEGSYFQDWRSLTRVHKQNITPQYFEDSEFEETWDHLECLESRGGDSDIQLTVPFKSKWWVKLFSSIISKRDGARHAKDREAMKRADEYPTAYLRELSIMQELWATPSGGSLQPQRMAILLWTFSQIRNGEAATTTWRPLALSTSASPYEGRGPILRSMQTSMTLDSALQEPISPMYQQASYHQTQDIHNSHGHHDSTPGVLFSENSEALLTSQELSECNTSSTTPILDYTSSFPSSTSASFPSSISNAGSFPSHHIPSFDSQASSQSSYPQSLESSFHSSSRHNDSTSDTVIYGMPTHPANTLESHDDHQPPFPDPQELLYPSQPSSVYGSSISDYHHHYQRQPTFSHRNSNSIDDPTLVIQPSNTTAALPETDFTSTALHIAYADPRRNIADQASSPADESDFQAPLIAPRTNMLPLQQVGGCLLNFESWVPLSAKDIAGSPILGLGSSQQQQQKDLANDDRIEEVDRDEADDGRDTSSSERICGSDVTREVGRYYHHQHQLHQRRQQPRHDPRHHQNHRPLMRYEQEQQLQEEEQNLPSQQQQQHQHHHQRYQQQQIIPSRLSPYNETRYYHHQPQPHPETDQPCLHPLDPPSTEMAEDDDPETQRQLQLQYLHDAAQVQDHWQQEFQTALWSGMGLQTEEGGWVVVDEEKEEEEGQGNGDGGGMDMGREE